MNFKDFKKNKNKLKDAITKVGEEEDNKSKGLETYYPKLDKDGNGEAIIRFLPQPNSDKIAYQRMYKHKAGGTGNFLSLFCPTSFDKNAYKDCPLCQIAGTEYKRQIAAGIKRPMGITEQRKASTVINVLVVEDDSQPDFVGRVMPMFIGRDLLAMIDKKLFPKKRGDKQPKAEVIYDLWEGRNFILDISKGSNGYPDYSDCDWAPETSPVATTENKIEEVFKQLVDLEAQYNNVEKRLSNDALIEKWDAFHSGGSTPSIGDRKKETEKQAVKDKAEDKAKKEAETKHTETFSTNDVSNDAPAEGNDEDVPW